MLTNQRGQSLIEYMLIVALVGIACTGILSALNSTIQTRFAQIITKLQTGKDSGVQFKKLNKSDYEGRDLSNFLKSSSFEKPSKSNDAE